MILRQDEAGRARLQEAPGQELQELGRAAADEDVFAGGAVVGSDLAADGVGVVVAVPGGEAVGRNGGERLGGGSEWILVEADPDGALGEASLGEGRD